MKNLFLLVLPLASLTTSLFAADTKTQKICKQVYGEDAVCDQIQCQKPYTDWLGTWEGPFVSSIEFPDTQKEAEKLVPFLDQLRKMFPNSFAGDNPKKDFPSMFRPYHNSVTYAADHCLRNVANGDEFIYAEQTDTYPEFQNLPAQTKHGVLITGRKADGELFLMTWNKDWGLLTYKLVETVKEKELAIWKLSLRPGMELVILDGRDMLVRDKHKRHISLMLSIKSGNEIIHEGPVNIGHHTQQKN